LSSEYKELMQIGVESCYKLQVASYKFENRKPKNGNVNVKESVNRKSKIQFCHAGLDSASHLP